MERVKSLLYRILSSVGFCLNEIKKVEDINIIEVKDLEKEYSAINSEFYDFADCMMCMCGRQYLFHAESDLWNLLKKVMGCRWGKLYQEVVNFGRKISSVSKSIIVARTLTKREQVVGLLNTNKDVGRKLFSVLFSGE